MLYVSIAKSLTKYIPIMIVPTLEIGFNVIDEIKSIDNSESYAVVSSDNVYPEVQDYSNWSWNFQNNKHEKD